MIVLGAAKMGLFGHIRALLFKRLRAALQAHDGPTAAATLARVRSLVSANLALGILVIAVMKLAAAG